METAESATQDLHPIYADQRMFLDISTRPPDRRSADADGETGWCLETVAVAGKEGYAT